MLFYQYRNTHDENKSQVHIIFIMGITIHGKTIFILKWHLDLWCTALPDCHLPVYLLIGVKSGRIKHWCQLNSDVFLSCSICLIHIGRCSAWIDFVVNHSCVELGTCKEYSFGIGVKLYWNGIGVWWNVPSLCFIHLSLFDWYLHCCFDSLVLRHQHIWLFCLRTDCFPIHKGK